MSLCCVSVVTVSLTRVVNSHPGGALWRAHCSPEVNSQLTRGNSNLTGCYVSSWLQQKWHSLDPCKASAYYTLANVNKKNVSFRFIDGF